MIHLEKFYFYSNKIVNVPDWVGDLPLTGINGFNNKILKLPLTLGKLRELDEANFAANVMMQLAPEVIENWRHVKILNLYECRLIKLCSLANLENLEELRLFTNNLEEVPEIGTRLNKLRSASAPEPSHAPSKPADARAANSSDLCARWRVRVRSR